MWLMELRLQGAVVISFACKSRNLDLSENVKISRASFLICWKEEAPGNVVLEDLFPFPEDVDLLSTHFL